MQRIKARIAQHCFHICGERLVTLPAADVEMLISLALDAKK